MTKYSKDGEISTVSSEFTKMVELYKEAEKMHEITPSLAIATANKVLSIANELSNREYQYLCYYILGRSYNFQGELDKALQSFNDSLIIIRRSFPDDRNKLSKIKNNIGLIYFHKDNRELSLDYFMKALGFGVKEDRLNIYNNIGSTFILGKNYNNALEYFELALAESNGLENYYIQIVLHLNISTTLLCLNDVSLAKKKGLEAMDLLDKYNNGEVRYTRLKIRSLLNLGEIYIKEGNGDKGIKLIDEAMVLAEERSHHLNYCRGLRLKIIRFLDIENEEKALYYLNETLEYSDKHQIKIERKAALKEIIQYYEEKGNYEKAYNFLVLLQKETELNISQSREDNIKRIKFERKKEIKLLETKNKEIQEQNLLLEQFAHIISHDLKEPIRNIVSFSSLLKKRYNELLDSDGREFLKYVIKGATTMNQNLTRLVDFTTLKMVREEDVQKIKLSSIADELTNYYEGAIEPFEVNISCSDNHLYMVHSHAYALLDEIVSNAIKFRRKGANCYIEINNSIEDNFYHLSIKDYGIGIESEFKKQIFRIFNRLNRKDYDGSGVGLAICQRIIKLYDGEIWIDSEPNIFTTVHIKIPLLATDI